MRGVCFLISTLLLLCLRFSDCLLRNQPRAVTENGVVIGKYSTSHYGKVYQSFQGIPYAKPPVDDNRFKEAERLDNIWIGEWNATTPGSPCLQYDQYTRHRDHNGDLIFHIIGDEDCLFLNVYTQEGGPGSKEVIVMIPGGAFQFGSGNGYGPEYIMERDDVVYVTFNYRVGPLGFLTTGDYFVPGNNGLKDQVAALEWVQRNIAGFGGDPSKVTIAGLSAGGASVHYHYLSPMSYGLFKKGYSYSGTALCPWALVRDGPQKTRQLASYLGCPTSDSRTIVKCLRRRPARKIVEQVKNFHTWMYNPFTVFGPVVEMGANRPFLDRHPRELLRSGRVKDIPWIAGVTNEEGLYPAADFIDNDRYLQQLNERWHALAPSILYYPDRFQTNIAEKMKHFYLNNQDISRATVRQIIKMLGDRLFVAPAVEATNLQAQRTNAPVFLYNYRYQGERSLSQLLSMSNSTFGACHGDDVAYIIKFYGFNTHININDKAMADFLGSILFTYSKTGRPPLSLGWEPVPRIPSDKATYLNIVTPHQVEMRSDGELGNLRIIADIFGHDSLFRDEL